MHEHVPVCLTKYVFRAHCGIISYVYAHSVLEIYYTYTYLFTHADTAWFHV